MTAPDPVIRAGGTPVNQRGRLRVMDDHEFGIERKRRAVLLVIRQKDVKILAFGLVRLAVERIVKRLGNVKELFSASHHVPANAEVKFFRERNKAVEDFRDAAAYGGGIDHLHAAA